MVKRGRILISAIVFFVLLISISSYFVFASSPETNTKSYDSATKTVTISYQNNPIGTLISQGQILITLGIIGGIVIAFILSRTVIKLKKK